MNTASAILAGYIAGCGNVPPDANPYHGNDELRDAWAKGNQRAWDDRQAELRRWMRRRMNGRKVN